MNRKCLPPDHGLKVKHPPGVLLWQMANRRWSLVAGGRSLGQVPKRCLQPLPISLFPGCFEQLSSAIPCLCCSALSLQSHSNGTHLPWTEWKPQYLEPKCIFTLCTFFLVTVIKGVNIENLLLDSGEYVSLYILNR